MPDAVLAIDQGTTGSTALVLDRDGRVLGRATEEFSQYYPQPGWVEHDPEEIWRVSLSVIGVALEEAGLADGELRAVGVTNQRETTVVWDRASGEPVHRAIVWQSRQTADICQQIRDDGLEPLIAAHTGLVVDPYFSGSKVKWILDHHPDARPRAEAGEIVFGTIDTWMLYKLTGGEVHATEPTNASRTLLYDIRKLAWDPELLDIFGVPEAMLPEIKPSSWTFGTTVPAGALPGGIPVAGMAGDQQAALYGQGCWQPGTVKNTYGTGCFVMKNTGSELHRSSCGLLTTVCCDAHGNAAYALEGSVFTTGAAIQWLRDEMGLVGSAVETEEVAMRVNDTQGVYVVPAFAGLGAPYWDMEARGAVVGLTRGSGREQIIRATLESIAYQTRDVVDAMNSDSAEPIHELRADGGAAANNFLMQFQADILGVPVVRPRLLETTAAGSAFLAGLCTGMWRNPEELIGAWQEDRRFEPEMKAADRDELYRGWQLAVDRVRADRREGNG
ncbi:MAG: glycerol kinase GlpK [Acidobacteria bacterium]|jgi:glycerol kinase|nr:glycerol kinase GlpK [Acidobacteriota bacterium]